MGKPMIMVSSITYAMRGRQVLLNNGFRADIVRTPAKERGGSCGYSLYVPQRIDEAVELLKKNGIKVSGFSGKENSP